MTDSILNLDRQICHALYSASNALVRAYRPLLQPLGLTYPQYVLMMSLWQRDGVSIKELARHTKFDAATLTPMLKRLESKNMIALVSSEQDERSKIVSLTSDGEKLKKAAKKVPEQLVCNIDLPRERALELKALCDELNQRLEQ